MFPSCPWRVEASAFILIGSVRRERKSGRVARDTGLQLLMYAHIDCASLVLFVSNNKRSCSSIVDNVLVLLFFFFVCITIAHFCSFVDFLYLFCHFSHFLFLLQKPFFRFIFLCCFKPLFLFVVYYMIFFAPIFLKFCMTFRAFVCWIFFIAFLQVFTIFFAISIL